METQEEDMVTPKASKPQKTPSRRKLVKVIKCGSRSTVKKILFDSPLKLRVQSPRKRYCAPCNKIFSNARSLRRHSVEHRTVPPSDDLICHHADCNGNKVFKTKASLRQHSKRHIPEHCGTCNQIVDNPVQHLEVAHPKVVQCNFCEKKFRRQNDKNRHEKLVHDPNGTKRICVICRRGYFSRAAHFARFHGEIAV